MVEYTELPPEAAALIQHQYDIDRADAGPTAPVSGFRYRGVQIESRCGCFVRAGHDERDHRRDARVDGAPP